MLLSINILIEQIQRSTSTFVANRVSVEVQELSTNKIGITLVQADIIYRYQHQKCGGNISLQHESEWVIENLNRL